MNQLAVIDAETVCRNLSFETAIGVVREAMQSLSAGDVAQLLRSFVPVKPGHIFALMPAADKRSGYFGAKLVSVFPNASGQVQHAGMIVLFSQESGQPVCLVDGEEVTRIRTAAASAVATDALAHHDAGVLAVLGCGKQGRAHIESIATLRPLREVRVWDMVPERAAAVAQELNASGRWRVVAPDDAQSAVRGAEIICTVTPAVEPVLHGAWVSAGAHVNVVGSSTPGPREIDRDLVVKSRFFVDHREHVLLHGAEFLEAKAAGAIGDDHILGEIGAVLNGTCAGRCSADEITLYKSLGHAVQDIAASAWLYEHACK